MDLQYGRLRKTPGSPLAEAIAAVRYRTVADGREPTLLAYTPVVKLNPYQHLIYQSFGNHGIATAPLFDPWAMNRLHTLAGQTDQIVVHLHWPAFVTARCTDAAEARQRADDFLRTLQDFRARGGRLVWTVHNRLAHDSRFPEIDARLQQSIADLAEAVHVMTDDTPEVLGDHLVLPREKVLSVAHPSYLGTYPDHITRDPARYALGIEADEIVYAVFGGIRPYKGIEQLVEGFNLLLERSPQPRRLIVAGQAAGSPDPDATERLVRDLRMHPYVLVQDTAVEPAFVQYLLRSADAMVVPHRQALNSGSAMLGPSFGLPLIANPVGVLPGLLDPTFTEFFSGTEPADVADTLERADRLLSGAARSAAMAFAASHDVTALSDDLARGISSHLALPEKVPAS